MSSDNNADTFNMNQKNKNILKKLFLKYENFFSWITLNKKNILQNKTINSKNHFLLQKIVIKKTLFEKYYQLVFF